MFVQDLHKPSIKILDPDKPAQGQPDQTPALPRNVLMAEKEDDWREQLIAFLVHQMVLKDKTVRKDHLS